jgi:hypothetical protein
MTFDEAMALPAFPVPRPCLDRGMSLRDYFAGQALAGMLANSSPLYDQDCKPVLKEAHMVASFSYQFADAMLKAREK